MEPRQNNLVWMKTSKQNGKNSKSKWNEFLKRNWKEIKCFMYSKSLLIKIINLSSSEALNFLCYEVEASSVFWSSTVSRHNIFNIDGNINIDGHFRREPNDLDAL